MRTLLFCLALTLLATPAIACLNDYELPQHEREFRSQYLEQQNPPPAPSADPQTDPHNYLLVGSGAALFACAVAVVLTTGRSRS